MNRADLDQRVAEVLDIVSRSFRLDGRIDGRPLGEILAETTREAAATSEVEFGTSGDRAEFHHSIDGVMHFAYRPHLFPDMDPSLRLGHLVQFHLLPRELPARSPVEAAAMLESYCHLSGDLFGWQAASAEKLTLWVLDVSGHGVRAGFAAVVMKLLLAAIDPGLPLDHLAEEMEHRFLDLRNPDDPASLYATGALLRVDAHGWVDYLSAGHPPLLVRRHDAAVERFDATGIPLVLVPELPKRVASFEIGRDDVVLIYTDGLLELCNTGGVAFEIERTEQVLAGSDGRPTDVLESLGRAIEDFHDLSRLDDDLSFVALRLRGH